MASDWPDITSWEKAWPLNEIYTSQLGNDFAIIEAIEGSRAEKEEAITRIKMIFQRQLAEAQLLVLRLEAHRPREREVVIIKLENFCRKIDEMRRHQPQRSKLLPKAIEEMFGRYQRAKTESDKQFLQRQEDNLTEWKRARWTWGLRDIYTWFQSPIGVADLLFVGDWLQSWCSARPRGIIGASELAVEAQAKEEYHKIAIEPQIQIMRSLLAEIETALGFGGDTPGVMNCSGETLEDLSRRYRAVSEEVSSLPSNNEEYNQLKQNLAKRYRELIERVCIEVADGERVWPVVSVREGELSRSCDLNALTVELSKDGKPIVVHDLRNGQFVVDGVRKFDRDGLLISRCDQKEIVYDYGSLRMICPSKSKVEQFGNLELMIAKILEEVPRGYLTANQDREHEITYDFKNHQIAYRDHEIPNRNFEDLSSMIQCLKENPPRFNSKGRKEDPVETTYDFHACTISVQEKAESVVESFRNLPSMLEFTWREAQDRLFQPELVDGDDRLKVSLELEGIRIYDCNWCLVLEYEDGQIVRTREVDARTIDRCTHRESLQENREQFYAYTYVGEELVEEVCHPNSQIKRLDESMLGERQRVVYKELYRGDVLIGKFDDHDRCISNHTGDSKRTGKLSDYTGDRVVELWYTDYYVGQSLVARYDENGRCVKEYIERGVIIYDYDRPHYDEVTQSGSRHFDYNGRLLREHGPDGVITRRYRYGHRCSFDYDKTGRKVRAYDFKGRLVYERFDGVTIEYDYQNCSVMKTNTDGLSSVKEEFSREAFYRHMATRHFAYLLKGIIQPISEKGSDGVTRECLFASDVYKETTTEGTTERDLKNPSLVLSYPTEAVIEQCRLDNDEETQVLIEKLGRLLNYLLLHMRHVLVVSHQMEEPLQMMETFFNDEKVRKKFAFDQRFTSYHAIYHACRQVCGLRRTHSEFESCRELFVRQEMPVDDYSRAILRITNELVRSIECLNGLLKKRPSEPTEDDELLIEVVDCAINRAIRLCLEIKKSEQSSSELKKVLRPIDSHLPETISRYQELRVFADTLFVVPEDKLAREHWLKERQQAFSDMISRWPTDEYLSSFERKLIHNLNLRFTNLWFELSQTTSEQTEKMAKKREELDVERANPVSDSFCYVVSGACELLASNEKKELAFRMIRETSASQLLEARVVLDYLESPLSKSATENQRRAVAVIKMFLYSVIVKNLLGREVIEDRVQDEIRGVIARFDATLTSQDYSVIQAYFVLQLRTERSKDVAEKVRASESWQGEIQGIRKQYPVTIYDYRTFRPDQMHSVAEGYKRLLKMKPQGEYYTAGCKELEDWLLTKMRDWYVIPWEKQMDAFIVKLEKIRECTHKKFEKYVTEQQRLFGAIPDPIFAREDYTPRLQRISGLISDLQDKMAPAGEGEHMHTRPPKVRRTAPPLPHKAPPDVQKEAPLPSQAVCECVFTADIKGIRSLCVFEHLNALPDLASLMELKDLCEDLKALQESSREIGFLRWKYLANEMDLTNYLELINPQVRTLTTKMLVLLDYCEDNFFAVVRDQAIREIEGLVLELNSSTASDHALKTILSNVTERLSERRVSMSRHQRMRLFYESLREDPTDDLASWVIARQEEFNAMIMPFTEEFTDKVEEQTLLLIARRFFELFSTQCLYISTDGSHATPNPNEEKAFFAVEWGKVIVDSGFDEGDVQRDTQRIILKQFEIAKSVVTFLEGTVPVSIGQQKDRWKAVVMMHVYSIYLERRTNWLIFQGIEREITPLLRRYDAARTCEDNEVIMAFVELEWDQITSKPEEEEVKPEEGSVKPVLPVIKFDEVDSRLVATPCPPIKHELTLGNSELRLIRENAPHTDLPVLTAKDISKIARHQSKMRGCKPEELEKVAESVPEGYNEVQSFYYAEINRIRRLLDALREKALEPYCLTVYERELVAVLERYSSCNRRQELFGKNQDWKSFQHIFAGLRDILSLKEATLRFEENPEAGGKWLVEQFEILLKLLDMKYSRPTSVDIRQMLTDAFGRFQWQCNMSSKHEMNQLLRMTRQVLIAKLKGHGRPVLLERWGEKKQALVTIKHKCKLDRQAFHRSFMKCQLFNTEYKDDVSRQLASRLFISLSDMPTPVMQVNDKEIEELGRLIGSKPDQLEYELLSYVRNEHQVLKSVSRLLKMAEKISHLSTSKDRVVQFRTVKEEFVELSRTLKTRDLLTDLEADLVEFLGEALHDTPHLEEKLELLSDIESCLATSHFEESHVERLRLQCNTKLKDTDMQVSLVEKKVCSRALFLQQELEKRFALTTLHQHLEHLHGGKEGDPLLAIKLYNQKIRDIPDDQQHSQAALQLVVGCKMFYEKLDLNKINKYLSEVEEALSQTSMQRDKIAELLGKCSGYIALGKTESSSISSFREGILLSIQSRLSNIESLMDFQMALIEEEDDKALIEQYEELEVHQSLASSPLEKRLCKEVERAYNARFGVPAESTHPPATASPAEARSPIGWLLRSSRK